MEKVVVGQMTFIVLRKVRLEIYRTYFSGHQLLGRNYSVNWEGGGGARYIFAFVSCPIDEYMFTLLDVLYLHAIRCHFRFSNHTFF
jgi:hypothetical protein